MQKCPICDMKTLYESQKPIKHWYCGNCKEIFVIGDDGTLSCLSPFKLK